MKIHLIAEIANDEGEWLMITGPIVDCPVCGGNGHDADDIYKQCWYCTKPPSEMVDGQVVVHDHSAGMPGRIRDAWYSGRNPVAYVALGADYPGIDAPRIFRPRNFPIDLSEQGTEWFKDHGGDRQASYFTGAELEDFDWEQTWRDKPMEAWCYDFIDRMVALKDRARDQAWRIVFNFSND